MSFSQKRAAIAISAVHKYLTRAGHLRKNSVKAGTLERHCNAAFM
jgi:hypothetical protein